LGVWVKSGVLFIRLMTGRIGDEGGATGHKDPPLNSM
jgi:hypothetical protein